MLQIASSLSLFSRSPRSHLSPPDRSSRSPLLDRLSPLESKRDAGEVRRREEKRRRVVASASGERQVVVLPLKNEL